MPPLLRFQLADDPFAPRVFFWSWQRARAYAALTQVWEVLVAGLMSGPAPVPEPPSGHPVEIRWHATEGCPDASWARAEVERFVGEALDQTRATQLSLQVEIAANAARGFEAVIVTTTEGGRRRRTLAHSSRIIWSFIRSANRGNG